MAKIIRSVVLGVYCVLILQIIRNFISNEDNEIIELNYCLKTTRNLRKLVNEIKKAKGNLTGINMHFDKAVRLPTDYKYILKWTQGFNQLDSQKYKSGQRVFLDHNCTYQNCYITTNKGLLVDLRHFNAFVFDVENTWENHPLLINSNQALIFSASEPSYHFPMCHKEFDNYFHFTWTYKLTSDIIGPYITILDKEDNIVGPKVNMTWIKPMKETPDDVKLKLIHKSKAVAWFVSNCNAGSRRDIAKKLSKALDTVDQHIDIYGGCGNLTCPRDRMEDCLSLLQNKYYFYLSFENSICEDYVTEKLLYPLLHFAVPIVFGGADYSRFLPPGSYIDAGKLTAVEVVSLMMEAMENKSVYEDFFRWHNHYTYKETPQGSDFCRLCEILNDPSRNLTLIGGLRSWWNPAYMTSCAEHIKATENDDFFK